MEFEYQVILDFEAINEQHLHKFHNNLKKRTIFCVSIGIRKNSDKKFITTYLLADFKDEKLIQNNLLEQIKNFIELNTSYSSWEEISKKIQFIGWNPDLENSFFKEVFKDKEISIKVKNVIKNSKFSFSLDRLTKKSKYDKEFFTNIKNTSLKIYEKYKDRLGFLASLCGMLIFCKINKRKTYKKDLNTLLTNINLKQLKNDLYFYSIHDTYKTICLYQHPKELNLFIEDYKNLQKEVYDDSNLIELKSKYKIMMNLNKINDFINSKKTNHMKSINDLINTLNNKVYLDNFLINENFEDRNKFQKLLKKHLNDLNTNKRNIENLEFKNIQIIELEEQISKLKKIIDEIENEKKQILITFKENFFIKYIKKN